MKGKRKFILVTIALIFVLLIVLAINSQLNLEINSQPLMENKSGYDSYNLTAHKLFNQVVNRVAEIRGYRPDVPLEVVTKEWVIKKWGSSAIDPESLKDEEVFYKSLLLVPSNFSFKARKNEEVGGFMAFCWEGKVYVVKENFDPYSKSGAEALAHELEHIIQDKYFNIRHDQTFDGDKAYGAVVEGDAVLMGWLYAGKNVSEEVKKIDSEINCSSEPNRGYEGESNLNYLYFFPYTFGTEYIARAYLKGGYKAVDSILRNAPTTTSQILHPGTRNFTETKLTDVELKYLDLDLQGFRTVKDTRMGEFFLYVFLSSHLDDCKAFKAADGWVGDNLRILRNGNEFVYYWKILFKNEDEAKEFELALNSMLEKTGHKKDDYWITGGEFVEERIKIKKEANGVLITGYGKV